MGAIVQDFPSLPVDAAPDRVATFTLVYAELVARGFAVPAQAPNVVTRAQLLAHLQGIVGELVKQELAGDPDGIDYGSAADDGARAVLLCRAYEPAGRRYPGSHPTGYRIVAGSTASGLVLATNPGAANPGFLAPALSGLAGAGVVRFRKTAAVTVVANRGAFMSILNVASDNTLVMAAPYPAAPAVGDICDIGILSAPQLPPRLNQLLRRIPFAPNELTAADVTAAKV